jgi:ribosomal protein S6
MPRTTETTDRRSYELAFVGASEATGAAVSKALTDLEAGDIVVHPSVSIRLAYPIKKHATGFFGWATFTALPSDAEKLSATLSHESDVLRFLVITPPVRRAERESRRVRMPEQPLPAGDPSVLSNEALTEKLQEILK